MSVLAWFGGMIGIIGSFMDQQYGFEGKSCTYQCEKDFEITSTHFGHFRLILTHFGPILDIFGSILDIGRPSLIEGFGSRVQMLCRLKIIYMQGCPYRFWQGGDRVQWGDWCAIRNKIIRALSQEHKPFIMSYIWVNEQHNGTNWLPKPLNMTLFLRKLSND